MGSAASPAGTASSALPAPVPRADMTLGALMAALASCLALFLCLSPPLHAQSAQATPNDYARPENWLCHPARQPSCFGEQDATLLSADGRMVIEIWTPGTRPEVDCFYVYPTISRDPTPNSDMLAGPEEFTAMTQQFGRFGNVCRQFAPVYRQVTLAGLRDAMAGGGGADFSLAYRDVADAWRHYLQNDNRGRGVVLIGHSQGSRMLMELLRREIEGKPAQRLLVSALLLGVNVSVPRGRDSGGALQTPLCRSARQTGCVVSYVSFRETAPPPPNARFGRSSRPDEVVACVNPAALAAGDDNGAAAKLRPYFVTRGNLLNTGGDAYAWLRAGPSGDPAPPVDTPFVSPSDMLIAECVSNEHGSYLSVGIRRPPGDMRARDFPGDIVINGKLWDDWGLHLVDVNLAQGNLLQLVALQARAWLSRKP